MIAGLVFGSILSWLFIVVLEADKDKREAPYMTKYKDSWNKIVDDLKRI